MVYVKANRSAEHPSLVHSSLAHAPPLYTLACLLPTYPQNPSDTNDIAITCESTKQRGGWPC